MLPAHQPLGANDVPRAIHLGLVVQAQLLLVQRSAQVLLQRQAVHDGGVHFGVKKAHGVAACFLGLVHGQVGVLHQVVGAGFVAYEQHHANAARALHGTARQGHGRGQGLQHFVRHAFGLGGGLVGLGAQAFQDDDELVPAQAGHGVSFAHGSHQALAHLFEQQVALFVAQAVVDQLEVVQVNEHQRPVQPRASATLQRVFQPVEQQAAVGQARERVVVGQVANFLFSGFALGDVGEGADVVRHFACLGFDGCDGEPFGEHCAAFASVPDFSRPGPRGGQRGLHGSIELAVVAPGLEQRGGAANGFGGAVAGDLGEGAVHAQDDAARVGDENAFLRFKGNGGNAQVFLCFLQLAVVAGEQAARPV